MTASHDPGDMTVSPASSGNAQEGFGAFDEEIFHGHSALMEAFHARDPERARELMRQHIEQAEKLALEAEVRVTRERLLLDASD